MAAMTRAVGIPSKLVSGLVYFEGGFAYHMWVEVWTGDGWYALDPTIGDGSVDATHIKLAESAAEDAVVADLSVGVLRTWRRLNVHIVEHASAG
jgi:transglutaminase-like putative cysteine protease